MCWQWTDLIGLASLAMLAFGLGGATTIWMARRPQGYKAGNGSRYRLERIQ